MHYWRWQKYGDPLFAVKAKAVHGSGTTTSDGYRRISVDGVCVLEHRHVMEQVLERALLSKEEVHHRNGVRTDNRPENLELWTRSQPAGQRVVDLIQYAQEIIDLYGSLDGKH
jgi:hypothetical protein